MEDIQQDLLDGRIVVVNVPSSAPPGLELELKGLLAATFAISELSDAGSQPLKDELLGLLDDGIVTSASDLGPRFLCSQFKGVTFWLEPRDVHWAQAWMDELQPFQEAVRAAPHGERCLFLLFLSGSAASRMSRIGTAAIAEHVWDSRVTRIDMLLYASYAFRRNADVRSDISTHVAASLACYDPTVVDRLASIGLDEILDPLVVREYLGSENGWRSDGDPCWQDGSMATVDGVDVVHSGHPSCAAIPWRIWRAQLEVLFPVLELRRLELISLFKDSLEAQTGLDRQNYVRSIEELGLGEIHWQLTRLFRSGRRLVDLKELGIIGTWREIRNLLAHNRVVSADLLTDRVLAPLRVGAPAEFT